MIQDHQSRLNNDPAGGPPCAAVAVPVFGAAAGPDGRLPVVGAVAVTVARERLLNVVTRVGLPPGAFASVQDPAGLTVARSFRDAETLGRPPMPAVLAALRSAEAGVAPRGTRTLEGVPSAIAFARAPESGYFVKVDVPEETLLAPLRTSLRHVAMLGAAVLSLGLLLAWMVARHVVDAFHRVPRLALDEVARGGETPATTGLREADGLAASLAAALGERDRADAHVRALFDSSPVGIFVADTAGRIQDANDAFLATIGRGRDELDEDGLRWDRITPPEWLVRDRSAIAQALASGRCPPYEKEYLRPDGSRVPVLLSFGLTDRARGLAAGFVVDLRQVRAAEAARNESEALARSILDATSDCVVVLDAEARLEFMNGPGQCGKEIDDVSTVIGRPVASLWPPESAPLVKAAIERARGGATARFTAFGPTAKGAPKWWDVTVSPLPRRGDAPPGLLSVARDVTEARQAEAALRASEARLQLATEGVGVGTWEMDCATGRGRWSPESVALLGVARDGFTADDWMEAVHPGDRAAAAEAWQRAYEEGVPYEVEVRAAAPAPDGGERWILVRGQVEREAPEGIVPEGTGQASGRPALGRPALGRPVRGAGVLLDVTARRRAEAALSGSEAFVRSVLEASTDCVKVLERDGTLVFMNEHGCALLEIDEPGAVLGRPWASLWPEESAGQVRAATASALEGREARFEAFGPTFRGQPKWWDVVVTPVRDPEGRVLRAVSVSRDVTERKRAEAALAESQARFRTVADSAPMLVWSMRADGAFDYFNAPFLAFTGLLPGEAEGNAWQVLIHPDDLPAVLARWEASLRSGEDYACEHRLRHRDGGWRWILARAVPARDAGGAILRWFGTGTDISEIVAAREVLARSHEDLERIVGERTRDLHEAQTRLAHVQRMEALGQLAGGIAHDFNNVLQAVQGGAALIERRPADAEGARRLARMIAEAAGRGASITRRLLAFSRRGDLRTEAVNPVALLTELREVLTHTLGTGIGVRLGASPRLPALLADKGQLETVLVNLATNARDAMAGSGVLTLSAVLDELPEGQGPGGARAETYVRLSVTDTGAGMPPEVLARATEPFFTTKELGKGTGLGLAMARGFAEQSGGGLRIESAPGRGTSVSLWFPLAGEAAAAAPAPESGGPVPASGRARILLVDDDAFVRAITAEGLEAEGYDVLAAADGAGALALLDAGEAAELMVCDLSMPGLDGLATIGEAQRRRPGLPAILLTGFATNAAEIALAGAMGGGFSLLRKPVTAPQLAARVALLLEGAKVVRESR